MQKLVVIDACVRQDESRTRRIAEPVISALAEIVPLDPGLLEERGRGDVPAWALRAARDIASADRILIAAPFWDMSFPAVLKCFFEQTSLFDVTFTDTGTTCTGLCKAPKVLYITTRGMDIPTGDPREQATPYLRALGSLWNLGELTVISAHNMDYSTPAGIEVKLSACIAEGLALSKDW